MSCGARKTPGGFPERWPGGMAPDGREEEICRNDLGHNCCYSVNGNVNTITTITTTTNTKTEYGAQLHDMPTVLGREIRQSSDWDRGCACRYVDFLFAMRLFARITRCRRLAGLWAFRIVRRSS